MESGMPNRVSRLALGLTMTAFLAPLAAQSPPAAQRPAPDMIGRIFSGEFSPHFPRAPHWFGGGDTYIAIEPAPGGQGVDVVKYDTATGKQREVLIPAAQLTPPGGTIGSSIAAPASAESSGEKPLKQA